MFGEIHINIQVLLYIFGPCIKYIPTTEYNPRIMGEFSFSVHGNGMNDWCQIYIYIYWYVSYAVVQFFLCDRKMR